MRHLVRVSNHGHHIVVYRLDTRRPSEIPAASSHRSPSGGSYPPVGNAPSGSDPNSHGVGFSPDAPSSRSVSDIPHSSVIYDAAVAYSSVSVASATFRNVGRSLVGRFAAMVAGSSPVGLRVVVLIGGCHHATAEHSTSQLGKDAVAADATAVGTAVVVVAGKVGVGFGGGRSEEALEAEGGIVATRRCRSLPPESQ